MASNASKTVPYTPGEAPARELHNLWNKIGRFLHIPPLGAQGDDPVCLSALDDTTLGRYGYNERQIHLMKEGTLR